MEQQPISTTWMEKLLWCSGSTTCLVHKPDHRLLPSVGCIVTSPYNRLVIGGMLNTNNSTGWFPKRKVYHPPSISQTTKAQISTLLTTDLHSFMHIFFKINTFEKNFRNTMSCILVLADKVTIPGVCHTPGILTLSGNTRIGFIVHYVVTDEMVQREGRGWGLDHLSSAKLKYNRCLDSNCGCQQDTWP